MCRHDGQMAAGKDDSQAHFGSYRFPRLHEINEKGRLEGGLLRLFRGGGGNRTRVRQSSAFGSTCLAPSFNLVSQPPMSKVLGNQFQLIFDPNVGTPPRIILCNLTLRFHAQAHGSQS